MKKIPKKELGITFRKHLIKKKSRKNWNRRKVSSWTRRVKVTMVNESNYNNRIIILSILQLKMRKSD